MRRAPAFVLLLGCAAIGNFVMGEIATVHAGEKVHTLSAGNLKIAGEVADADTKVRVTNPGNNSSAALPAKTYSVKLAAGRYQLELSSDDIDCVLVVQDNGGKQLAFDDDSGKGKTGLDSRLVFQANEGTYKIVAASFDGSTGPFTLTIKQLGGAGGAGQPAGPGGDATKPIQGSVDQNAPKIKIQVGGRTATLPAKLHEIKLQSGKYQIDAVAKEDLDPVIIVQDGTGKQLGFNDDVTPGNLNSRLTIDIGQPGTYKVYVAALKHDDGSHGEGAYTLTVKQLGGAGQPAGKGLALKDGMLNATGTVTENDPKVDVEIPGVNQPIGLHAKLHEVNLPAGRYQFDITSADFDTFLVIQDKAGKQLAFDDDGGEGLNSRLQFQINKADTYKIWVAALSDTGDFKLTIKSLGAGKGGKDGEGKLLDIGVRGARVNGALSRDTKTITYRVKMEQGKSYVIEMNSPDQQKLDPYVEVRDANGKKLAEDDDGAGDLNARLVFTAPQSGEYQIVARSFLGVGVGDFTLSIKQEQ